MQGVEPHSCGHFPESHAVARDSVDAFFCFILNTPHDADMKSPPLVLLSSPLVPSFLSLFLSLTFCPVSSVYTCSDCSCGREVDRFAALVYSLGEVWTLSPGPEPLCNFLAGLFKAVAEPTGVPSSIPSSSTTPGTAQGSPQLTHVRSESVVPTALAKGATDYTWRTMEVGALFTNGCCSPMHLPP